MLSGGSSGWIGARLLRRENERHLLGAGIFVADIRMPGLQDVALVRSPMAHGRLRRCTGYAGIVAAIIAAGAALAPAAAETRAATEEA